MVEIKDCNQFSGVNNSEVLNERWDKMQQQFCCSQTFVFAHGFLHIFHFRKEKIQVHHSYLSGLQGLPCRGKGGAFSQPVQTQGYGDTEAS